MTLPDTREDILSLAEPVARVVIFNSTMCNGRKSAVFHQTRKQLASMPLGEWELFAAAPTPPAAEAPRLTIDDLTALSRVWNESHSQPHGPDYRVNEWLKTLIAHARVHGAIKEKSAARGRPLTAEERLGNLAAALASDKAGDTR
ncbi:hypothetical protein [Kaistia terrae]|uniref:Uncharacterized protein n=1 Tax=Kaistia terrae TaxID=537017 RepID=A0ABW0Q5A4_9HYPH|nr:hypothetical protein [Kaistia terrae]MCX5581777.1 hypothetical protein [Kaistia terrae]